MSNQGLFARRGNAPLTVPRGDVLGEYATYPEAQQVVDRLAKSDFAVKGLVIVGSDLTTVERVTGRLSYARAALTGAGSGAWLGLFFGLLLFLFSPVPEFSLILAAALIGAGFGMTFGIASYAINRRRRDFSSTHQVLAGSYRIIIDPSQTAKARQALAGGPVWPPSDEATPADRATDAETPIESPMPAADRPADTPSADAPTADTPSADAPSSSGTTPSRHESSTPAPAGDDEAGEAHNLSERS